MTAASRVLKALQTPRLFQFKHLTSSLSKTTATQIQKDALSSLKHRMPIYLASIFTFLSIGTITHVNDDYYPYYPLPYAIDIAEGGSMMPTMIPREVYLRDCWSDRFFWFRSIMTRGDSGDDTSSTSTTRRDEIANATKSYQRPYQKGDVVTIYNPYSKSVICKRIIGVGGDTIRVFGEYAQSYHEMNGNDFGVPPDDENRIPYCQKEAMRQNNAGQNIRMYETEIHVPNNHVWVEGDNPLCSIDSRHYGPLPVSSLRGRVFLRLWPIRRDYDDEEGAKYDSRLSSDRPRPFMSVDEIIGCKACGVEKIEKRF